MLAMFYYPFVSVLHVHYKLAMWGFASRQPQSFQGMNIRIINTVTFTCKYQKKKKKKRKDLKTSTMKYIRTSVAETLMASLPRLFRTRS